ncbi:VOC family protein [Fulvivirga imtechensis]|nr:VOC family protein [Fulvivirga imtechensis]
MKNQIGRIVILVEDYNAALEFYQKNFGFKKLHDVTTDVGQRFLHIGTDKMDALGIWFLRPGRQAQKSRVGDQTTGHPVMVIYTTDINQLYHQLKANDVKIKVELVMTPEYKFFHCLDLYGNEIVVVELPS